MSVMELAVEAGKIIEQRDGARAERDEARALLADALNVQRFPCDHKGIGKPGCAICDPRVWPGA